MKDGTYADSAIIHLETCIRGDNVYALWLVIDRVIDRMDGDEIQLGNSQETGD